MYTAHNSRTTALLTHLLAQIAIYAVEDIEAWIKDVNETEETEINFPIVADETGEISRMVRNVSLR